MPTAVFFVLSMLKGLRRHGAAFRLHSHITDVIGLSPHTASDHAQSLSLGDNAPSASFTGSHGSICTVLRSSFAIFFPPAVVITRIEDDPPQIPEGKP